MTVTKFLNRVDLWSEVETRIPPAKRVLAAISYFGTGAAELLPLRKGDTLVVDMSLRAVRQGVTNPKEIQKLFKQGVEIFSRSSLHAKLMVIDDILITSSANVSQNARHYLDEAGLMTDSPTAVSKARRFVESLRGEPVLDEYLKQCIAAYEPPKFKAAQTIRQPRKAKRRSTFWFVSGLIYADATDPDQMEKLETAAQNELADAKHSEVEWIEYSHKPGWFDNIVRHNWVIRRFDSGPLRGIWPPAQVIRKATYGTKSGKKRYVLLLDSPINAQSMALAKFRKAWMNGSPSRKAPRKRSGPLTQPDVERCLARCWTYRGRVKKQN